MQVSVTSELAFMVDFIYVRVCDEYIEYDYSIYVIINNEMSRVDE
jgi:hypothetical protein